MLKRSHLQLLAFLSRVWLVICFEDCVFHIPRQPLPGVRAKVIPATNQQGTAIFWQDGDIIRLRHYRESSCSSDESLVITQSDRFWVGQGGLAATASTDSGDELVVAWIVDADIWFAVVNGSSVSTPVRANDPSPSMARAEVEVKFDSLATDTFHMVWTSFDQDGDGWGIFHRSFHVNGTNLTTETQVNVFWRNFQWHPELALCGDSLWVLWINGTDSMYVEGGNMTTGPWLRRFDLRSQAWDKERSVDNAKRPDVASLACDLNSADPEDVQVLWLQKDGQEAEAQQMKKDASLVSAAAFSQPATPDFLSGHFSGWNARPALKSDEDEEHAFLLLHETGKGLWVSTSIQNLLEVRYLVYSNKAANWLMYPKRNVQYGARDVHATWLEDGSGNPQAVILCWETGSQMQRDFDGPSEFTCYQKHLAWFLEAEGWGFGLRLPMVVMLFLLCAFCCFKQFTQTLAGVQNRGRTAASETWVTRRRAEQEREAQERQRLDQLRVQLAGIPEAPPPSSEPKPGAGADCPICQSEVSMRVALQNCGHTCCRDCALKLVEHNQRCHICRGTIDGFLPVYI